MIMQTEYENGVLTLCVTGTIDARNAPEFESKVHALTEMHPVDVIVLNCDGLEYVSSAGLRVILRLKNEGKDVRLVNVHGGLYEILETTGFTEMMTVQRGYRMVSIQGCEVIGKGANGTVYRLDNETVVKVYDNQDSLAEIQREREIARMVFVHGIPTAIPYDVVRIQEGGYGSVYEMLNAQSYAKLLINGEKTVDELAEMSIGLLKLIHSHTAKPGLIPAIRDTALKWALVTEDWLPADRYEKLRSLLEAVPDDLHLVHGDFHIRNIMFQNGESLLIDMDKFSYGYPIFELAAMYNSYCGYSVLDSDSPRRFFGISQETARAFWDKSLALYLGTGDERVLRAVEDKIRIIAATRMIRHFIRRGEQNTPYGRDMIAYSVNVLDQLLPQTDTLLLEV